MTNCLKIGDRLFSGDQIISALIQYKLLDTLIGHLLLDEAIQTIPLSQEEVWQWLSGSSQTTIPDDFETYLAQWCDSQGITMLYFKAVVLREWRVEKFKYHHFAQQLESEFLRHRAQFDQVEYSVIQLENATLAQEIYYQLRDDGREFIDLVHYSLGVEWETGGRVGPVPLATLPIALQEICQPGQIGVVQKPLTIGDRYWVVRIEQLTSARLTEATKQDLTNRLFNQWLQTTVNTLTATPGAIAVQPEPSVTS